MGEGEVAVEGVSRFGLETRECETSSDTLGGGGKSEVVWCGRGAGAGVLRVGEWASG